VRRASLVVVLVLVLAACRISASVAPSPTPATSPGPGSITWPAISLEDSDTFGIDISGTGADVSKVEIRSRFGTVSLGGRVLSALVYEKVPWNSYSLVLYQALAVEAHSWTVFWFYCKGASLTYVYWESTTSSKVNRELMNGSCATTTTTHATVSWLAGSMPAPPRVTSFSVHGANIEISPTAAGHVTAYGRTWVLYPYALIDCSKNCGAPGWYELHSLLWDSDTGETAYGILYLITDQPHRVELEYALELPLVVRAANATFDADWSRT
jgi:hypothetical protein